MIQKEVGKAVVLSPDDNLRACKKIYWGQYSVLFLLYKVLEWVKLICGEK